VALAILAICIFGSDIAIYVLYERLYGEKNRRGFQRPDRNRVTLRTHDYHVPAETEF